MGKFNEAMQTLANGIKDLSTLEVVTFQGAITLTSADSESLYKFDEVMARARANPEIKAKVLASTRSSIDGDIVAFYDTDITEEQRLAHAELVEMGSESRKATIEFVKSVVGDIANL